MRLWTSCGMSLLCLCAASTSAQFSEDGGRAGSTAIHRDSSAFAGWATAVDLVPGYFDIARPSLGRVSADTVERGTGPADGSVVSLGDGGQATLVFGGIVRDGPGDDFVVFENGFALGDGSVFAELAFVEVSSDGRTFVRFPSTSLTPSPVGTFGTLRPEWINGLAGKFSAPYGVGFDLSELPATTGFDASRVTHIRLLDVIGAAETAFAKTDSEGALVYDPYPTPFPSGGFDLDAVGLVHPLVSGTSERAEGAPRATLACYLLPPGYQLHGPTWRELRGWVDLRGLSFGESRHEIPTTPGWYTAVDRHGRAFAHAWIR